MSTEQKETYLARRRENYRMRRAALANEHRQSVDLRAGQHDRDTDSFHRNHLNHLLCQILIMFNL
ncbi:hypothetical protein ACT9SR_13365, partial [Enterococcus faecalis]|uniref:hypothetical protein n=1 Tax=Enterococcus faecalis TaxID=1351 RepID=UPI00403A53FE